MQVSEEAQNWKSYKYFKRSINIISGQKSVDILGKVYSSQVSYKGQENHVYL